MARHILKHLYESLDARIRRFHADTLCRWVADFCSRPLTISRRAAVVIAPHQDDETLGCGGLIAMKRQMGVPVTVIFLTNGANSHSDRPDIPGVTPENLVLTRKREAVEALAILGVDRSDIHFLNAPDGRLDELNGTERKNLIDRLAQVIGPRQPVELYVPHRKDRHKDHEATWDLVQELPGLADADCEIYQYVIWMPWRSPILWKCTPADLRGAHRLEISCVLGRKIRAIGAYRSQHGILPPGFLGRFQAPHEVFFRPPEAEAGVG